MQNSVALSDDSTLECKMQWKCTLLQAVLLHNQKRFTELAQEIKERIHIVNEDDITRQTESDLHTVINEGS